MGIEGFKILGLSTKIFEKLRKAEFVSMGFFEDHSGNQNEVSCCLERVKIWAVSGKFGKRI